VNGMFANSLKDSGKSKEENKHGEKQVGEKHEKNGEEKTEEGNGDVKKTGVRGKFQAGKKVIGVMPSLKATNHKTRTDLKAKVESKEESKEGNEITSKLTKVDSRASLAFGSSSSDGPKRMTPTTGRISTFKTKVEKVEESDKVADKRKKEKEKVEKLDTSDIALTEESVSVNLKLTPTRGKTGVGKKSVGGKDSITKK